MRIAIFTDTYLPEKNGVATSIKQIKEGFEKKVILFIFFAQNVKKQI